MRLVHGAADSVFQRLSSGFGKLRFFEGGVGDVEPHAKWVFSLRTTCASEPRPIKLSWSDRLHHVLAGTRQVKEAEFESPLAEEVPLESRTARFALLEPEGGLERCEGVVVHLAGTGDHGYVLRMHSLGVPLLRHGVASIILENALYGRRKPAEQRGAKLRQVSDLLTLGRATIEETRSIVSWLSAQPRFPKIAVVGFSMGGLHAAMAASLMTAPVGVVAAFSPPNASVPFLDGELRHSMNTAALPKLAEALRATDIRNFPKTHHPAVLLCGNYDRYVNPQRTADIWTGHWPHMDVRWIPAGHLTGLLLQRQAFQRAVLDVLAAVRQE